MKKALSLALLIALVISPFLIPSLALATTITLTVDGKQIYTDVPPVLIDGRVMVPVRNIFDALGGSVVWDSANDQVYGSKGADKVWLTVGSATAYHGNYQAVTLDVPAQIINGRTMVPLRFIAESLGCRVNWDPSDMVVSIESGHTTPAEDVYNQIKSSLVEIKQGDSLGSGFFFLDQGVIVTNVHVINGTGNIEVKTYDNKTYKADVESLEPIEDIAILKLENASTTYCPIYSCGQLSSLHEGEGVIAIGNSFGLDNSISTGIISGVRPIGEVDTPIGDQNQALSSTLPGKSSLIQMTAPISPGSSGGPVFDMSGNVIGIAVASLEGGQNINFAVPIDDYFSLRDNPPQEDLSEVARFQSSDDNFKQYKDQLNKEVDNDMLELESGNAGGVSDLQNNVLPIIDSMLQSESFYKSTDPDIQYCVDIYTYCLSDDYSGMKDLIASVVNNDDTKAKTAQQELENARMYALEYYQYRQNILCLLPSSNSGQGGN